MHQKTLDELSKIFSGNLLLSYFDMTLPTYIFIDAHKTGLGAILCQGKDFENLKPAAIVSQWTNQTEKDYAQAMAIGFSHCKFCSYLLGLPNETAVIADHFPSNKHFQW